MINYEECIQLYSIFSSFDHRAFRWMMTMVFAVEEINRDSRLLPGVKLGYRIMDSCDHVHTSMQALFSLISYSNTVTTQLKEMEEIQSRLNIANVKGAGMQVVKTVEKTRKKRMLTTVKIRGAEGGTVISHNLENNENYKVENATEDRMERSAQSDILPSCLAGSPVSAVIGLASSSPTRAVAHTLGPFNIPLVRRESEGMIMYSTLFLLSFLLLHAFLRNHTSAFKNVK